MQSEMRNNQKNKPAKQTKDDENDDYDDELQDQMAESLFEEADQMGIFKIENMMSGGVDYAAALQKIEKELKKSEEKKKTESADSA
tara:strand:+ start:195 stop:452 length:258 start_codon:yes stop_codon:yes gene_type:complete